MTHDVSMMYFNQNYMNIPSPYIKQYRLCQNNYNLSKFQDFSNKLYYKLFYNYPTWIKTFCCNQQDKCGKSVKLKLECCQYVENGF